MKIQKTIGLLLAFAGLFIASSKAISITGSIDMSGTVLLDSGSLGSATQAQAFSFVKVGGTPTGSFAGIANGTDAAWQGFSWPSASAQNLWTVSTFSFVLNSVSAVSQTNTFLNLLGSGTLKSAGFEDTNAVWSFTISNPTGGEAANFSFTFANSQTAVPDGGSAVILLGAALVGLVGFGRRFNRA